VLVLSRSNRDYKHVTAKKYYRKIEFVIVNFRITLKLTERIAPPIFFYTYNFINVILITKYNNYLITEYNKYNY